MKLLRWLIRFVGISFLCAVYAACAVLTLYPRWWTVAAVATIAIVCSAIALLLLVASFMPKLETLKHANAARTMGKHGAQAAGAFCKECGESGTHLCSTHSKYLCTEHGKAHVLAGCDVVVIVPSLRSVSNART